MSRNLHLGALGLLALGLGLAAGASGAPRRTSDLELLILSTTSNRGEVDPCGWHKSQKGGLARRAGLIDSLRAAKGEVLVVDAGDYAHPTLTHEDRENWFILKSMGEMRYDAMTLGELELLRGADYVKSIADSSKVPIVLANARYTKSGKPLGQRFLIRKVGGVTYGIIGLLGQDFGEGKDKFTELGFTVDDPFEVAGKLVPEVKKQVDLVVVLAHLGSADAFQLPKAVPGIDVVIFGHYPGTVAPTQVEGAVTVRPGQRGQYIGETKLVLSPENKIVSYSGDAVALDVKTIGENPKIAAELKALKDVIGVASPADASQSSASEKASGEGDKNAIE